MCKIWRLGPVVLLSFLVLGVQITVAVIVGAATQSAHMAHVATVVASILMVLSWLRWRMQLNWRETGFSWDGVRTLRSILLGAVAGVLSVAAWLLVDRGSPAVTVTTPLASAAVFLSGCSSILLSPIYEEILYRSLYYHPLRRRFGVALAVLGQALIFSAFHLDFLADGGFQRSAMRVAIGVILGVMFEATRSLHATYTCHSFMNLGAFLTDGLG